MAEALLLHAHKIDHTTRATFEATHLIEVLTYLKKTLHFDQLLDVTAIDEKPMKMVYILRSHDFIDSYILTTSLDETCTIDSATSLYESAHWLERETYDQYGVNFAGHPNLTRILNHEGFVGHPLRKDYPIAQGQMCHETLDLLPQLQARLESKGILTRQANGSYSSGARDIMYLNLGPSHPASHGTIRTFVALEGESIVGAVNEIGYLHRGFEKSCENHTYNQIIPYTDRLNYCSSLANNVAFAKTIEEMLGVTLPDRGIFIRVMLIELSRIIDHLVCLGANLVDLGALTNYWYLFNPRETAYDFLTKLTGARLTNSYMRVGGMAHDLFVGWEEEMKRVLADVEQGMGDTLKLIEHNRIFHDRTQNVGILTPQRVRDFAISGPNARASGVPYDMRKTAPYYYYESFDFDMVLGSVGDVYDRMMVRFEEIRQSMRIIRQIMARIPSGAVSIDDHRIVLPPKPSVYGSIEGTINHFKLIIDGVRVSPQSHYSAIEAVNGELGFFVLSNGTGTPAKVKVKAPSFTAMAAYASIIEGGQIADAIATLGSINIIAGEMDR